MKTLSTLSLKCDTATESGNQEIKKEKRNAYLIALYF